MSTASTWHDAARALELTPYVAKQGFSKDLTFPQVRALVNFGASMFGEPRDDHWLRGFQGPREVFVIPFTSATSGADWTICVVSCDLPEGQSMFTEPLHRSGPLSNLSRDSLLALFMPGLDFGTSICEPTRRAARARGADVLVGATLSRALVARAGRMENFETLRADLMDAERLASDVFDIETFVPKEWRAFSERQGLSFDEAAMRIEGDIRGARVAVELRVEDAQPLRTKVRVECLEQVLAGNAAVENPSAAPLLRKLRAHDLHLGTADMDARYIISGDQEESLRDILLQPVWQATLELPGVTRLWVKERELVWTLTGCPPRASELDVLAECIRSAVDDRAHGPYR